MRMKSNLNIMYFANPTGGVEDRLMEILKQANAFRNQLCEIEQGRRERWRQLVKSKSPRILANRDKLNKVEEEISELQMALSEEKKHTQTKNPKTTYAKNCVTAIKQLKAEKAALKAEYKTLYEVLVDDPDYCESNAKLEEMCSQRIKSFEGESELFWGTRGQVRSDCSSFRSGRPPKFKRFGGEGQLAVQIQKGTDPDLQCKIEKDDSDRWVAKFRVGTIGGEPDFVIVPITKHREIPEGYAIKWAYLQCRKRANKNRWALRLTVEKIEDFVRDEKTFAAVSFEWKRRSDGLQVATVRTSGSAQEDFRVVLSEDHLRDYERLDRIKSKRQRQFNDVLGVLRSQINDVPKEIRSEHSSYHCSPKMLAIFVLAWSKSDHPKTELLAQLNRWRKSDKRLWQHICRLSERVVNRRNNYYRNIVKKLSDKYGVLYFSKPPTPEKAPSEENQLHSEPFVNRFARCAAPATFLEMLKEKYRHYAIEVPSKNLRSECNRCGTVESAKAVKCKGCGTVWSASDNASRNVVARGRAMQENGVLLELQEQQRVKARKDHERRQKMQEGRRRKQAARKAALKL